MKEKEKELRELLAMAIKAAKSGETWERTGLGMIITKKLKELEQHNKS